MANLLQLLAEYVAYMGAMALVAWRWERRTGRDAFGLITALVGGVLAASFLSDGLFLPPWLALTIGAIGASALFATTEHIFDRHDFSLLGVLYVVTASLLAFDGVTQHSPVAFEVGERGIVPALIVVTALVWSWEVFSGGGVAKLIRRIGYDGRWAISCWRKGLAPHTETAGLVVVLALFLPIVGMPLSTTGILSATLLKDVALAILLARVTGSRPPGFLLAMVMSLGCARLLLGYLFSDSAGPPLVEAGAIIAALLWLRQKGIRAVLTEGKRRGTAY